MRDDRQRLLDIIEAIERIEKYVPRGRQTFEKDELIQTWILRHLQIIGEAARNLSDKLRNEHPEVPWSQAIGMRNVLVHNYFQMDFGMVWSAVTRDLPEFKRKIEAILQKLGESAP